MLCLSRSCLSHNNTGTFLQMMTSFITHNFTFFTQIVQQALWYGIKVSSAPLFFTSRASFHCSYIAAVSRWRGIVWVSRTTIVVIWSIIIWVIVGNIAVWVCIQGSWFTTKHKHKLKHRMDRNNGAASSSNDKRIWSLSWYILVCCNNFVGYFFRLTSW